MGRFKVGAGCLPAGWRVLGITSHTAGPANWNVSGARRSGRIMLLFGIYGLASGFLH